MSPPAAPGRSGRATLLLAGGGLANGLIAYRLATQRPEVDFQLVEGGAVLGGDHTWSFFAADLEPGSEWIEPLVVRSWDHYHVRFPRRRRRIANSYRSITSTRFHEAVLPVLGERVSLSTSIASVSRDAMVLRDGRTLRAELVLDGRGPAAMPDLALGYQKFVGQTVALASAHGLSGPIIMDATVDQKDGYRFVYVLPWDERTVLIEDTRYADGDVLDTKAMRRGVHEYATAQGWVIDEVLAEEQGVLPVALDGDIEAWWRRWPDACPTGLRAALFHPTTGYSLPDAVALANAICALPVIDAVSVSALVRDRSIGLWRSRGFFRLLNRMLFRAGSPDTRYRVLERFYGLSEPLISRFYAGRPTRLDRMRILTGKPPVPFGAALRCIHEKGHA